MHTFYNGSRHLYSDGEQTNKELQLQLTSEAHPFSHNISIEKPKKKNEKVRSMASFLQTRMEKELAIRRWIRNHRNYNHQILSWSY
ncbi:hypothetical protein RYX36_036640 [Vicia faba]